MSLKYLFQHLPDKVKVNIVKGKSGSFIAELPEYDVFTEAKTLIELNANINDLIYAYFDVPKEYQSEIWYSPATRKKSRKVNIPDHYKILVTPEYHHYFQQ